MANTSRRGEKWRGQVLHKGRRHSASFDTQEEATAWADATKAKLLSGWEPPARKERRLRRFILPNQLKAPILSATQIVGMSRPYAPVSGVYFLICDNTVVYVGQSTNVLARIASHRTTADFDRIAYIRCPRDELDMLEAIYIATLNPKRNSTCPRALPSKYIRAAAASV